MSDKIQIRTWSKFADMKRQAFVADLRGRKAKADKAMRKWQKSFPLLNLHVCLLPTDDPRPGHFAAAGTAIRQTQKNKPEDDSDRRFLAIKLLEAEKQAFAYLGLEQWPVAVAWDEAHYTDQHRTPGTDETFEMDDVGKDEVFRILAGAGNDKGKMLALDERAADFLATIGKEGREMARELRTKSRKRWQGRNAGPPSGLWHLWRENNDGIIRFRLALARALWVDQVRPHVESVRRRQTAIPVAASDKIIEVTHPSILTLEDGRIIKRERGQRQSVVPGVMCKAPTVPAAAVHDIELNSDKFWLSILGMCFMAHEQWVAGNSEHNRLVFKGGATEFVRRTSKALDYDIKTHGKTRQQIMDALRVQAYCEFKTPLGHGNLIALWEDPEGYGFVVTLGELIAQGAYDFGVRKGSRVKRLQAKLIPLLKPASMNSVNRKSYGPVLRFQHLLVREMALQADALFSQGGAEIHDIKLAAIASQAGMPRGNKGDLRNRLLDQWTIDDDKALAFLEQVDRNRYNLADNERYGNARKWLTELGEKSHKGKERRKRRKQ
jgi:hypothetical protein